MNIPAGMTRLPRKTGGAFSLVELLLAVSLLLLLLGAVAFNFSSLQRGAELDEGASQFEALIRYARAHAASTGRKVRITFEEDAGDGLLVPLGNFSVSWEPDPLGQPGLFLPLPETAGYVDSILDVICIEDVRPAGPAGAAASAWIGTDNASAPEAPSRNAQPPGNGSPDVSSSTALDETAPAGFAPILFQPDGSSDSVEITIAARNNDGEDTRRMILRLAGLTGAIRRRVVAGDPAPGSDPTTVETGSAPALEEGTGQ